MAHKCRALVLFCMDYRLNRQLFAFLDHEGLLAGGADIVRLAGAAKNLARPASEAVFHFVMEQIDTSRRLHHIDTVYLVNHEDCGAYGPEDIPDSNQELQVHRRDLLAGAKIVEEAFPGITAHPCFMWLDGRCQAVT
ncbi:MAG: hypothetical protein DRI34_12015 [Deltaproteobacteria bacterium]|nr:MAG: hypothetical protein DRI34_12015 [Deltaproteobacteria bacterium]